MSYIQANSAFNHSARKSFRTGQLRRYRSRGDRLGALQKRLVFFRYGWTQRCTGMTAFRTRGKIGAVEMRTQYPHTRLTIPQTKTALGHPRNCPIERR